METISLTINDRAVTARADQTILEAASAVAIDIPHLCYDPRVTCSGACRMCVVEIEGQHGLQTSCTRQVEPGMVIQTQTDQIHEVRKTVLELYLSEHRVSCTTCDKSFLRASNTAPASPNRS